MRYDNPVRVVCRLLNTAPGGRSPEAARDLSELRRLLNAFNEAKKTAGLTIVTMLVTGLVLALLAGAFVRLKVFGVRSEWSAEAAVC